MTNWPPFPLKAMKAGLPSETIVPRSLNVPFEKISYRSVPETANRRFSPAVRQRMGPAPSVQSFVIPGVP